MIPEIQSIIQDLEAHLKGGGENEIGDLLMRTVRELESIEEQIRKIQMDDYQHMWNAIHKIAAATDTNI